MTRTAAGLLLLAGSIASGAGEARAAPIKSVQTGTVTLAAGSTSVTATLSPAVDTTRSFLVFGVSEDVGPPVDGQVSGQITDSTTLTFQRNGTATAITIKWYVAEFLSRVRVLRGSVTMSGTPGDTTVPLPAVNPARSFPLISVREGGASYDGSDFIRAEIINGGADLALYAEQAGPMPVVEWQVVEHLDANVQTNTTTLTMLQISNTATLAPAVNLAKSWLVYSYECRGNAPNWCDTAPGNAINSRLIRGVLTDGITLTFDRNVAAAADEDIKITWYLVEFTDATTVLRGSEPFAAAEAQRNVPLTSGQSGWAFAAGGGYMRGGRSALAADTDAGVGWFTLDLTSGSNLQITRGNTTATADVGWFVVQFPKTIYRSIGTAADYNTGSVSATNGSVIVTGSVGVDWKGANRGRGDRIQIDGVNYTILSVDSPTQLTLTSAFTGGTGSGKAYTISRQLGTLALWEDCIDGPPGTACPFFPVTSASLVTDQRSEVGIAYKDSTFTSGVGFNFSITDANHTITLTADAGNRHYGRAGQGVVVNLGGSTNPAVRVQDDWITVEWLELTGGSGSLARGFLVDTIAAGARLVIRNNLIHAMPGQGIRLDDADINADIYNNIIYEVPVGIRPTTTIAGARILNNTIYNCNDFAFGEETGINGPSGANITLSNNLVHNNATGDIKLPGVSGSSSNNLTSDASATAHSPGGGDKPNISLPAVNFESTLVGFEDLHIKSGSAAENAGADLSSIFNFDIDGGARAVLWDIGADDIVATTSVELIGFAAAGLHRSVRIEWETASELNNLGFHVYRGTSARGPYERVTGQVIPGLGSSPVGARYRHTDSGLVNGTTYFYRLEDIETTGKTKMHGPVSATPQEGADEGEPAVLIVHGEPEGASLRVLEKTRSHALIELVTPGFTARPREDGTVELEIPGFVEEQAEGRPAIPVKRTVLDAVPGRNVRIVSVRESDTARFSSLTPSAAGALQLVASRRGVVEPRRTPTRSERGEGLYPDEAARLLSVGFQGEVKKALLELAPVRWDPVPRELRLARRLLVRVAFSGRELAEHSSDGLRGRRQPQRASRPEQRGVVARLATRERGLYAIGYEALFARESRRDLSASTLRLSRQGKSVAFHIEPNPGSFAPGSLLYFWSAGESLNPNGREAVYELELGETGETMPVVFAAPAGPIVATYLERIEREENRYYQAGLLDAPDLWLWDLLFAPDKKGYAFALSGLAPSGQSARLQVWLQGVSDLPASPDHHLRVYLNEALLEQASGEGKAPLKVEVDLPTTLLREGENILQIENVGDTGAAYSMVMLDRFTIDYPRKALADGGRLEGSWKESGTAEVRGLTGGSLALDLTEPTPRWLSGLAAGADGALRFRAEAGRRYLLVEPTRLLTPEVRKASSNDLRSARHTVEYLVLGPRELLPAAEPLLSLRKSQGLRVRAVAIEDVFDTFGFGESPPESIRNFLAYAYHNWRAPSLRYALLLGDATYDFKDYLQTGVKNRVPPLLVKTSHLWTASDPTYAAVNGEDPLPDLAIGRLPAATLEEAKKMVEKIVAYEAGAAHLQAPVVLVADNPDAAGDFLSDAEEIAANLSSSATVRKIYLPWLGVDATRSAIRESFDQGASLLSYIGHGGIHLWAHENLFDLSRVGALGLQPQQPVLVTLNCLNGYFHFPYFNSLSEELLKAEGKGAIAAFSPSGLSLNGPAHVFHKALVRELTSRNHRRLGDAVLAAQAAYAETGVFPELLSIYHLLGDPALRLK
jgi:hypothetical protein